MGKPGDITAAVKKIYDEVVEAQIEQFEDVIDRASKMLVDDLKATSPKDTGAYSKGWSRRKLSKTHIVVHNKKHYRLTHLLEHGHIIRNKDGTYGRTKAQPHIAKAEQRIINQVLNDLQQPLDIKIPEAKIEV